MASTYDRPHLTFQEQLEKLEARGLEVTDHEAALRYLGKIGYYRLSAYWYPMRELRLSQDVPGGPISKSRADNFVEGSTFANAVALYIFDKKLRLLVLDALERVEVAIRVDISYNLGAKDKFAHTKPEFLHGNFTKQATKNGRTGFEIWHEKYQQSQERAHEDFLDHYKNKHGLPLPIWVSVELWDFGMLSHFYKGMQHADKTGIAKKYGIPRCETLESWLRALNFLRNVAAHHSRLWNKNLIDQPKYPKRGEIIEFDALLRDPSIAAEASARVYSVLCILIYLVKQISPTSSWPKRLLEHIESFPGNSKISVKDMGFPSGWQTQKFWT